ncbi:MAG: glutamate-1-semialdehyde 2,1-aminomutase [Caldilinea sp. CFX5]|nr:glutamate-1-semialdehyde 2,1-aminomutase [Caldilinea sp. CFX5]
MMQFSNSKELQRRSHALIPGGAHTYAKGDDQYPEQAPGFICRGEGCHVWDMDGNEFIEYGMGLRSVTLGHAYRPVMEAAWRQMQCGNNFTRPAPIEVTCAEQFLRLIPGADMVKFAKNGSDVTTAALKLARAYTGRELVAICGDHPFFSVDDWFIGSTPMAAGIPQRTRQATLKFRYNDLATVEALFAQYPNQIACLVMEAETTEPPADNFLHKVQQLCHQHGALFVLDEIITGFRWHRSGAQQCYDLQPDLSTFAKAMGNGFSVAALAGKRAIMELGGLSHNKERVFLLSTTYGAETFTLAAALATMQVYAQEPVVEHLHAQGAKLRTGIDQAISAHGLAEYVQVIGRACNLVYVTRDQEKQRSQPFRTLFLQETIKRGLLMPSLVVSYSHTDADIQRTVDAIGDALVVYRQALDNGIENYLVGRPVAPVFRTYN